LQKVIGVMNATSRIDSTSRIPKTIPLWLNFKQIEQLLSVADKPRDYGLVDFMWLRGCRIAEVVGARVDNVQI
jgi:integrase